MLAGVVTAIVRGLVQPLLESWNTYMHGRTAQQRDDLQATVEVEREIRDALQADRADRKPVDLDLVRREIERRAANNARPPGE